MKVYALVYDYQGYEELVVSIFSTRKKVDEYVLDEYKNLKYTDKKMFLDDSEYTLVEWELDTNKQKKLKIRL